ncbi:MAG: hypothetical protein NTW28_06010 [Candidatus Solibacter sp.]|nr:hypothetical protein [Candidatus Solibacter sp.]
MLRRRTCFEFLREWRRHEKAPARNTEEFPNRDIQVPEKLLRANEPLLTFLSVTIFHTAMQVPGVADGDVLEALDGLIRTYRTLESGVYYESRPNNPLAGALYETVQGALAEYRSGEQQELGMTKTRDADVLGLLVFLQHVALLRDNGRRRGRAFLDALRELHPSAPAPSGSSPSSMILR